MWLRNSRSGGPRFVAGLMRVHQHGPIAAGSIRSGTKYFPGMVVQHDPSCAFCNLPRERIRGENPHAIYIRDGYPISPGHTLIIPKRHIKSLFEATGGEWMGFFLLINLVKQDIEEEFHPEGYNLGVNDGPAAGQTVPHLHLHLIPRYHGDRKDPRGGVRWIIPDKADYWSKK